MKPVKNNYLQFDTYKEADSKIPQVTNISKRQGLLFFNKILYEQQHKILEAKYNNNFLKLKNY